MIDGVWKSVASVDDNIYRLISVDFSRIKTDHIRINLLENYSLSNIRLYEIRCYADNCDRTIR